MASLLVTGGAGFIGSCFLRQWIEHEPDAVVNLDKLTYAGNPGSLVSIQDSARYTFCQGDIGNPEVIRELLETHQPRAIVNFAAESHVDRSIDGPMDFVMTNVAGTVRLLDVAREYWAGLNENGKQTFRFLHVSTDEVYGSLDSTGKFTEQSPYAPNSPYSASKASSDHFVRAYHHTFGLPTLITNCSNNYGPFQFPEKLIPLVILNALENKPLPVYGDGQQVRDWLFVEDHCHAIGRVLDRGKPGETYNIGGNCERTNLEVVEHICDLIDQLRPDLPGGSRRQLIQFVSDRPGHDRRYAIDASKMSQELGWQPEFQFEQGLELTVRWYLENQEWIEGVTSGNYQRQRLGLG